MLVDIPENTVQMITEQAQLRGVSMVQLLNQTFDNKPKKIMPLAQCIHERFDGLYENNKTPTNFA